MREGLSALPASDDNLLVALHRWASPQEENFVTEAFAHLLRHLLRHEPPIGVDLLRFLTGGRMVVTEEDAGKVTVVTQFSTSLGVPDIRVAAPGHLAFVEVKVESGLRPGQLRAYRRALSDAKGVGKTSLTVLSLYPARTDGREEPDVHARWYGVTAWLAERCMGGGWRAATSCGLVQQFVGFARRRGLAMERVTEQLVEGVSGLRSLTAMLEYSLEGNAARYVRNASWGYIGWDVEDVTGWIGIEWEKPSVLLFHTQDLKVSPSAAEDLGFGDVKMEGSGQYRLQWQYGMDLATGEARFFALPLPKQVEVVTTFVRNALEALSRLGTRNRQKPAKRKKGVSGGAS